MNRQVNTIRYLHNAEDYLFLHYRLKKYANNIVDYFTLEEIYEAQDTPLMIHYAQPIKPWQCKYVYKGDNWIKYTKHEIKDLDAKARIIQYIQDNQKPFSVQLKYGIRYWLKRTGVLKILLSIGKKI